jgi:DNA-binding FadR family transcriptional regulator
MGHLSDRVSLDQPLMFHRRIYAAIREHKADDARRAMIEHLIDARSLLVRPGAKQPASGGNSRGSA